MTSFALDSRALTGPGVWQSSFAANCFVSIFSDVFFSSTFAAKVDSTEAGFASVYFCSGYEETGDAEFVEVLSLAISELSLENR